MNVFHFLLIFPNASESAVEKSRLPGKAPLSSARVDAKRRARLDRFHYTRDDDRHTGEYDRRPRRGGIAKEDRRVVSTKRKAGSAQQKADPLHSGS
jgi:hypothetical protein